MPRSPVPPDAHDASALAAAVRRRLLTAESVLQAHLEVIARTNDSVNALVQIDADGALSQVRALDERLDSGFGDLSPEELTDPLGRPYTDCWTVVTSLCGLPALSVPMGTSAADGMPADLMITGQAGADAGVLALGARFTGP